MKVRIGTRGSDLALWQAHHVKSLFAAVGVECEIIVLKTRGDVIDDVSLSKLEGKGFFTAEIERALLDRDVDVAVHSHKDLPTELAPGLVIAAVPARGPQTERLLIAPHAHDPSAAFLPLKHGARVGTSAPRRLEQLRTLRPDLDVLDLRGNVPTRVRKAREGQYDAVVLAAAGLDRLKLSTEGLIAFDMPIELFVPAPAQGALAIQVRAADRELFDLVRSTMHDDATAHAIEAERSLLSASGGGCSLPVAAALVRDGADLRPGNFPPPTTGGRSARGAGNAASAETWTAYAFLGAGHPVGAVHGRWSVTRGAEPRAAIAAALAQLSTGAATHIGPLGGLRVALTGTAADGSVLGERLAALGASVVLESVVELQMLAGVDLAGFLARARAGDVLALTSRQAARALAGHAVANGVTIAAVGRASARALSENGFTTTVFGDGGGADLAAKLEVARGATVFWPCAEEPLPEFERALAARGIAVQRLALYRTRQKPDVALTTDVDARVYMSPSAVHAALSWERANVARSCARYALGHATGAALEQVSLVARKPACERGPITEALVAELARQAAAKESAR